MEFSISQFNSEDMRDDSYVYNTIYGFKKKSFKFDEAVLLREIFFFSVEKRTSFFSSTDDHVSRQLEDA